MEQHTPFGNHCEYHNFQACVRANQDKDDPEAYCAVLMRNTEEACKKQMVQLDEIREQELEALEQYRKGLTEPPVIYRALFGHKTNSDEASGLTTFVASEESEDRMGDVIQIDGWQLDNFKKNPVFMYVHDLTFPPLGKVPKIEKSGKQLLASVRFDDNDPFAKLIHDKYDMGFMNAVSVGFRALEYQEAPVKSDMRGLVFTKQELVELSAVPVPAHPKALKRALGTRSQFWLPALPLTTEASFKELLVELKTSIDTYLTVSKPIPEPEPKKQDEELFTWKDVMAEIERIAPEGGNK